MLITWSFSSKGCSSYSSWLGAMESWEAFKASIVWDILLHIRTSLSCSKIYFFSLSISWSFSYNNSCISMPTWVIFVVAPSNSSGNYSSTSSGTYGELFNSASRMSSCSPMSAIPFSLPWASDSSTWRTSSSYESCILFFISIFSWVSFYLPAA